MDFKTTVLSLTTIGVVAGSVYRFVRSLNDNNKYLYYNTGKLDVEMRSMQSAKKTGKWQLVSLSTFFNAEKATEEHMYSYRIILRNNKLLFCVSKSEESIFDMLSWLASVEPRIEELPHPMQHHVIIELCHSIKGAFNADSGEKLLDEIIWKQAGLFGVPYGLDVENLDESFAAIDDNYEAELLLSYATGTMNSGGHLALCVKRDNGDEDVYSANFYASGEYTDDHYFTRDLIACIPKHEYLYGTRSTVDDHAHFGLDFGEVFKRSVLGVRIYGLKEEQIINICKAFDLMNEDYTTGNGDTHYHTGKIVYDYLNLNCAKSVASAFKYGGKLDDIVIYGHENGRTIANISGLRVALSHTPLGSTISIINALTVKGCKFKNVLYQKFHSDYNDDTGIKFNDFPNRFPVMKSLDFFKKPTEFEAKENIFGMYLLSELVQYRLVQSQENSREIIVEPVPNTKSFEEASSIALEASEILAKPLWRSAIRLIGFKLSKKNNHISNLY